jgi:signal recognition particle subunit SRP68
MAEGARSYSMEKKQVPNGGSSRQRIYLIGQLKKVVKWADHFTHLCMAKGDSRTSLEATAYASFMRGSLLLECGKKKHLETTLMNFKSARVVYDELGKYGDVENRVLCRQRVDEMEPNF